MGGREVAPGGRAEPGDLLLHLREVPVGRPLVGAEVVADVSVVGGRGGGVPPRARDPPGLRVVDDGVSELRERCRRKRRSRREAAGVRDESGTPPDLVPVEFGDAVGRLEVGRMGYAVGLLVDILREPVVGREVDGLYPPPLRKRPGNFIAAVCGTARKAKSASISPASVFRKRDRSVPPGDGGVPRRRGCRPASGTSPRRRLRTGAAAGAASTRRRCIRMHR